MALTLYLINVLANLSIYLIVLGGASATIAFASLLGTGVCDSAERTAKNFAIVTAIAFGLVVFLPSKTDMYIIAGVSLAEKTINTPEVRDAANLIKDYIKLEIEARAKELKK